MRTLERLTCCTQQANSLLFNPSYVSPGFQPWTPFGVGSEALHITDVLFRHTSLLPIDIWLGATSLQRQSKYVVIRNL